MRCPEGFARPARVYVDRGDRGGISPEVWKPMSLLVQWSGWAVMSLAIGTCSGGAKEGGMHEDHLNENAARAVGHLTPNDRIGDLLAHSAFRGFAPLLLPWDGRAYDERMPLSDVGALLPYHSHVRPDEVVGALNRMIDDATAGKMI